MQKEMTKRDFLKYTFTTLLTVGLISISSKIPKLNKKRNYGEGTYGN